MKKIIKPLLWLLSLTIAYLIYDSINAPIQFKRIKTERFTDVINRFKDIKVAQESFRSVNGYFANNFKQLVTFIDSAEFVITQQRDTSWLEYDEVYKIDLPKEAIIIDTLGFASVKDSIFPDTDRYKLMEKIPHAQNGELIQMKSKFLSQNGYKVSVYEIKAPKEVILYDQPKDLLNLEKNVIGVDEIDGPNIVLGSLSKVSTTGNWPASYDKQRQN